MFNLQALKRTRHASQRWKPYTSYAFTAGDALCSLVNHELPKAMMALPIAFLAEAGAYTPVAVLGLNPGKNLFVAQNGKWLASYIPAIYRSYPFAMGNAKDGKQVLCIDEDSGLLSETQGERFFTDDGQPAKAVTEVISFLNQVAVNRVATQNICALLQKHNLIQPWPIKIQGDAGAQTVAGLFRIDETALNQLPAEALLELRDAGALLCAYCQLLSMQHLHTLGQLAAVHAKSTAPTPTKNMADMDLSFLEGSETFKFF